MVVYGILYKYEDGPNLLVIPESLETDIIRSIHEKGHFAARLTEKLICHELYKGSKK